MSWRSYCIAYEGYGQSLIIRFLLLLSQTVLKDMLKMNGILKYNKINVLINKLDIQDNKDSDYLSVP